MLAKKSFSDLETTEARLDDRVIQSKQFMEDDDFIKSPEFKGLLYKIKQNELTLSLRLEDDKEKTREMVRKLIEYDPESEEMSTSKVRELVQRSGMNLTPTWDLEQAFMLDQIRRHDKAISFEAYATEGLTRGSEFNIDTNTLAIWSIAPETNKPKLMDVQSTPQGNLITWDVLKID